MDLKTQLDALRVKFLSTAPGADVALVERMLEELAQHVRGRCIPGVGDTVPDFTLPDMRGRSLRLSVTLAGTGRAHFLSRRLVSVLQSRVAGISAEASAVQ